MNFYYHPILGLQYSSLEEIFVIDMRDLPEGVNLKTFIKNFKTLFNNGIYDDTLDAIPNIKTNS